MKLTIIALATTVLALSVPAHAQSYGNSRSGGYDYGTGSNSNSHYVRPHTRSDGSYVDGHHRTNPNGSTRDNYGASGNYNPYSGNTGRRGTAW
jgi:hypothetical protein